MNRIALGVSVWAVAWALALAAVVLAAVWELPRQPLPGLVLSQASPEIRSVFPVIGVTVALVYGPVAALLLFRRVNAVGVILAVHALGSGLGAFGSQWGLLGSEHPGLPLWGLLAFASGWSYIPGTFMTAVLPVLVTRARIPTWQRALVAVGAANALAATLASLVQQTVPEPRNPLAIPAPALQAALPVVYLTASFVAVGLACASSGILIARWARARGRGRTGLAWLTVGHVFLTGSYAVLVLPDGHPLPGLLAEYGLIAPVLGQVIYPAAILVVVLGQGLWGQRVVFSRIVLWALLTVSGVGLYLGIVLTVPRFLPWPAGLQILVPLLIAIAIQPLRSWIQRRIDQLVYGEGADPATLIARLGERVGELDAGPAGLRELCEALRRELRLASVEIVPAGGQGSVGSGTFGGAAVGSASPAAGPTVPAAGPTVHGSETAAPAAGSTVPGSETAAVQLRAGEPVGTPVRIPVLRDPEAATRGAPCVDSAEGPFAELVVSAPGGQRLDRRSLRVLRDLTGLVASALHIVESNRRLALARDDFFAERAEERRAIQRELHDGLGPALAGIGFGLAAVSNLASRDPVRAESLLAELEQDLAKRVRAVRTLAEEVSPSPLDGMPLSEALAELAARFRTERFAVRLAADPVPEIGMVLTQEQQDALYFIAAEALTNAARHSGASEVEIRLGVRRGGACGGVRGESFSGARGEVYSEVRGEAGREAERDADAAGSRARGEAALAVVDNGSGLPETYLPGVGLASIRERAEALGGALRLRSSPAPRSGLEVAVRIPLTD